MVLKYVLSFNYNYVTQKPYIYETLIYSSNCMLCSTIETSL